MFGMLDYRAHKLFRFLRFPFVILGQLLRFVYIAVAIIIAQKTTYGTLLRIIIAYLSFEVMALLGLWFIWTPLYWAFKRVFFWLVDVVPAHGANDQEARSIVQDGRFIEL
jgi:hypothetical protein